MGVVVDPHGVAWTVKRRWIPRYQGRGLRERLRKRPGTKRPRRRLGESDGKPHWYDWLDIPDFFDSGWILAAVLGVLLVVFLVLFGIPALLALVDLVVVLAVTVAGAVARFVVRRPWTVEARSRAGQVFEARVVGWRKAGVTVSRIAHNIEAGWPSDRGLTGTFGADPSTTVPSRDKWRSRWK